MQKHAAGVKKNKEVNAEVRLHGAPSKTRGIVHMYILRMKSVYNKMEIVYYKMHQLDRCGSSCGSWWRTW